MSAVPLLELSIDSVEEARVIRARGEVDMSSVGELRRQIDAARGDGAATLLDLSEVTFMDSTGLHLLIEASRRAETDGWPSFVIRPSPPVRRLLEVSGTLGMLPVVVDE
jgi:anti-sigma B factor antagonist